MYLCQWAFGQGPCTSIGVKRSGGFLTFLDRGQRHITVDLVDEHALNPCFKFAVVIAELDLFAIDLVNRQ